MSLAASIAHFTEYILAGQACQNLSGEKYPVITWAYRFWCGNQQRGQVENCV